MSTQNEENIFHYIWRIIRLTDLYSRQITKDHKLNIPQLLCLREISLRGESTPSSLAKGVFLSRGAITGILDRLEERGLVQRQRIGADRRKVFVGLTPKGRGLAASLPNPWQSQLSRGLGALPAAQQREIERVLGTVVEMMKPAPQAEGEPGGQA